MRLAAVIAACLALAACIGTSPEQADREALGDYDDGDEEHRPGQPCLTCHGADFHPGGDVFAIAGTVYFAPTDGEEGIEGAEVEITDDDGRVFTARTNRTGNFMFEVDGDTPRVGRDGRSRIPWQPTYPLRVVVRYADMEQEMESLIWREGACAGCHVGSTNEVDTVPKVYVSDQEGL